MRRGAIRAWDSYDAIAAVPFAIFLALLTVVRAFRSYQPDEAQNSQRVLLVRGAYLTCLAVVVTVSADVVAMLRYPSVWIGKPSGSILAAWEEWLCSPSSLDGGFTRQHMRMWKPPGSMDGSELSVFP